MTSKVDLSAYGLTRQQSNVYQTGLQYGNLAVSRLARLADIHRVTTHNIVKELMKKGFCSSVKKGGVNHYQMVQPKYIHNSLLEKAASFESLLPGLNAMVQYSSHDFRVEVFEGIEGVKRLYLKVLDSSTDLRSWTGTDHMDPELREWLYDVYVPQRVEKGLRSSIISTDTQLNKKLSDTDKLPSTRVRVLDDPLFSLHCEQILFDENKILIAATPVGSISGMLIESKLLYDTYSSMFDWTWRQIG